MKSILTVCAFMVSPFADFIACAMMLRLRQPQHGAVIIELLNHGCPHKFGSMKRKMNMVLRIIKLLLSHFAKTGTVTNCMPALRGRALLVLPMP